MIKHLLFQDENDPSKWGAMATTTAPASGETVKSALARRTGSRAAILVALIMLLAVVTIGALSLGPVVIPFGDTVGAVADRIGAMLTGAESPSTGPALVVTEIRLPRVTLSLLAGAGLAVAGAVMQAFFRNPLADPGVTGVSSGAAVGAVAVLAGGIGVLGPWTLPAAAFVGAIGVMALTQLIGFLARDSTPVTLLLVGIALNAFLGAVVGAIIANAPDPQIVRGAVFWLQGDLNAASWDSVRLTAAPVLLCIIIVFLLARELDALLIGDDEAHSIGVNVGAVRAGLLVLTAVLVGAIVAMTGVIGFVGLVVPHVARLVIGGDHRMLLPASALLGATFLTAADTVARVAVEPVAWQTGVVTAFIGSPVFLALVLRTRRNARTA